MRVAKLVCHVVDASPLLPFASQAVPRLQQAMIPQRSVLPGPFVSPMAEQPGRDPATPQILYVPIRPQGRNPPQAVLLAPGPDLVVCEQVDARVCASSVSRHCVRYPITTARTAPG